MHAYAYQSKPASIIEASILFTSLKSCSTRLEALALRTTKAMEFHHYSHPEYPLRMHLRHQGDRIGILRGQLVLLDTPCNGIDVTRVHTQEFEYLPDFEHLLQRYE